MKGIIVTGMNEDKLLPLTKAVSKELLPVHDKPLIYYSLSILMFSGIKEILVITKPEDLLNYVRLLGDGSELGIQISYLSKENIYNLPEAIISGEEFIGNEEVALISNDYILFGYDYINTLQQFSFKNEGAVAFTIQDSNSTSLTPSHMNKFKDVGLYFYDNKVLNIAKNLYSSLNGSIEIKDINKEYLKNNSLKVEFLGNDFVYFNTETSKSLSEASNFIEILELKQGSKIACLEEISFKMGYINQKKLLKLADPLLRSDYGKYLVNISNNGISYTS